MTGSTCGGSAGDSLGPRSTAGLGGRYGLCTPDALRAGASWFITNDDRLKKVTELEVVLLDELA